MSNTMQYHLLGKHRQQKVRTIAAEFYNSTSPFTMKEVKARLSMSITWIFIGIALRLAVEYLLYWLSQKWTKAPIIPQVDEPCYAA